MSYFATVIGWDSGLDLPCGRLIPLAESQHYIRTLAPEIERRDGVPAFLWDDGESGTTAAIVDAAVLEIQAGANPADTDLGRMILLCARTGATLRVWWAHGPDAHAVAESVGGVEQALALIGAQGFSGSLGFIFAPGGAP